MQITKEVYVTKDYNFSTLATKLRVLTKVKGFLEKLFLHEAKAKDYYRNDKELLKRDKQDFIDTMLNANVGKAFDQMVIANFFRQAFGINVLVFESTGHKLRVKDLVNGTVVDK